MRVLLLLLVACRQAAPESAPAPASASASESALCDGPGCLPGFRATTIDGAPISSDDLRGKVTLVLFWASWCEPCTSEGPTLDMVYRSRRADLAIVGFSRDTAPDAALRRFRDDHTITYPIIKVPEAVDRAFGAPSQIPAFLLYGRDGRLRWRMTGALPAAVLERELDAVLREGAAPMRASFMIAVLGPLRDAARAAGALAALRAQGPVLAVLVGDDAAAGVDPRAVNLMKLDAWATAARPDGIAAPAVATDHYLVTTVAGRRVAVVRAGDPAAATAVARSARADGEAELVVALGLAEGADVVLRALPSAGEAVTIDPATGATAKLELASATPDPRISGLH
jgi:thiol-disulfide isomerase/thioredoxin